MQPIRLDQSNDGQTIVVNTQQSVALRLPENPGTGYRWQVPSHVQLISDEFEASTSGMAGATGVRIFTLASGQAPCHARFELRRPWNAGDVRNSFTLVLKSASS